eukprot:gene17631-biopygen12901
MGSHGYGEVSHCCCVSNKEPCETRTQWKPREVTHFPAGQPTAGIAPEARPPATPAQAPAAAPPPPPPPPRRLTAHTEGEPTRLPASSGRVRCCKLYRVYTWVRSTPLSTARYLKNNLGVSYKKLFGRSCLL